MSQEKKIQVGQKNLSGAKEFESGKNIRVREKNLSWAKKFKSGKKKFKLGKRI